MMKRYVWEPNIFFTFNICRLQLTATCELATHELVRFQPFFFKKQAVSKLGRPYVMKGTKHMD